MRFTAVFRAPSRAKVRPEDPPLVGKDFPSPIGPLTLIYRTRYDEAEFGVALPRELWIEATGEAAGLEEGVNAAWNAAASLIPVISLTTNAAIGDPRIHLAFETTPGVSERAFFQAAIEDEHGLPTPGRRVPIEATVATIEAVSRSETRDAQHLLRAASEYLLALKHWRRGFELLCVEYLFMAAEALKVVALRKHLKHEGLDHSTLAPQWGVDPNKARTIPLLEAEARRRIVFHGDDATSKQAADISNGFEHGYSDFGDLHGPAGQVRDATARHVRRALLELAAVPGELLDGLTTGRYEAPLDVEEYVRYIRGELVGDNDDLALPGHAYPFLEWTSSPTVTADGDRFTLTGTENFTVRTAAGIAFRGGSWELWGPRSDPMPPDVPPDEERDL